MDESRGFIVEAVQTIGVLVDEGVVLRDELPADFGRIDGGRAVGGHDGDAVDLSVTVRVVAPVVLTVRTRKR